MTKPLLAVFAAMTLLAGLFLLGHSATALTSSVRLTTPPHPATTQKAGCYLAGRYCGVGHHWVCGLPPNAERRRCRCVPC